MRRAQTAFPPRRHHLLSRSACGHAAALPFSHRGGLAACTADPEQDALVPISIELRNTSGSRAIPLTFTLLPSVIQLPSSRVGIGDWLASLEGDLGFTGSGSCLGARTGTDPDVYRASWETLLAPGSTVRDDFFLILRDYYAFDPEAGERTLLQSTSLVGRFGFGVQGAESWNEGVERKIAVAATD